MSGKCKSNPIKTNNLIYIMIFFYGGGRVKKIWAFTPPPQKPYLRPCNLCQLLPTIPNYCQLLPSIANYCHHTIANLRTLVDWDCCLGNKYPPFSPENWLCQFSLHISRPSPPLWTLQWYVFKLYICCARA